MKQSPEAAVLPHYPPAVLSEITTLEDKSELKIPQTHNMTAVTTTPVRLLRVSIQRLSSVTKTVRPISRQLHLQSRPPVQKSTHHQRPGTKHFSTTTTPKIPLAFPSMVSEDDFILTLSCPEYVYQVQLLIELLDERITACHQIENGHVIKVDCRTS